MVFIRYTVRDMDPRKLNNLGTESGRIKLNSSKATDILPELYGI